MIDGLEPYPTYKNSSVPWLGDVPEHWEVRRIKTLFRERDERTVDGEGVLLSLTRKKGILPQSEASSRIAGAEDLTKYKVCRPGDLVMNRMQAWSGMFAVSTFAGVISPDYSIFERVNAANVRFFENLFKTPSLVTQFAQRSKGIGSGFNRLYTPDFGSIHVAAPPLIEQIESVKFLDYADARIRRYVQAIQKLIKLLEEEKQAIIHRTVTRGLDSNVRLKPSGVPWLGDVPEHWEVVRSGSMFRLFGGFAFPGTGFVRDESDETLPILLTPVNFDPLGGLRFGLKSIVRFRGDVPAQFKLREGDLVTVLTDLSQKRLILGRAGFIDHDGVLLNQRTARVDIHTNVRSRLNAEYLSWVLNSCRVREQTISTSRGSTVFHTSPTRMLSARWPLPPLDEQLKSVEKLRALEKTQLQVRDRLNFEIFLLREYRTRLIADVVTGKLDVREAASKLPEEVTESEPLDEINDLSQDDLVTDEIEAEAAEEV